MRRPVRFGLPYWVIALAAAGGIGTGCGGRRAEPDRVAVSVFAASSLTEAFAELEGAFEQARPEVDVQLTFAGSQVLRLQLEQGAPADVFASANEVHMRELEGAGVVGEAGVFARNELVVIVPTDNPAGIDTFAELGRARRLVIGGPNVPVGVYTRQLLERAELQLGADFVTGVRRAVVSEENNVRLVRAKVELGEADAAIVYRTDAVATDRVTVVPIPDSINVRASYPIATVVGSRRGELGRTFIDFLASPTGQQALRRHGFITGVP